MSADRDRLALPGLQTRAAGPELGRIAVATLQELSSVNPVLVTVRRSLLALAICIPAVFTAAGASAFEPVNYKGAGATIELSRLGTYRGGVLGQKARAAAISG